MRSIIRWRFLCYTADTLGLFWVCWATLQPWLPNLEKTQQPRYVIEPETCKYSSILRGYNKWYISKLNLKKETTKPNDTKIKDDLVLQGMPQAAADDIE